MLSIEELCTFGKLLFGSVEMRSDSERVEDCRRADSQRFTDVQMY